jgi:hypothetical protein
VQGGLAAGEGFPPQVVSVQFNDVEGAQEYLLVIAPIPNQVEAGDAVRPAGDCFPAIMRA